MHSIRMNQKNPIHLSELNAIEFDNDSANRVMAHLQWVDFYYYYYFA